MLASARERNVSGRLHWQSIAYLLLSFGKDSKRLFFYRRQPDIFLRPSAAFCPVVSSEVMPRMTVVVAVVTRRKTCFPTVGGAMATKAKPSEDSTAFCIYLILMATISNLISFAAIENK